MKTMRSIALAALGFFAIVFGAGFALALVRVPLLVPKVGERYAELIEMPIMLAVILWAASRMVRSVPAFTRAQRLLAGLLALLLMLAAELAVAFAAGAASVKQVILERDPVSGAAYAVCLLVFALAPAVRRSRPRT